MCRVVGPHFFDLEIDHISFFLIFVKNKLMLLLIAFILFGIISFVAGAAYGKFPGNVENYKAHFKKENEKMFPE